MKKCSKDVEITLDDGTVVEAKVVVTEFVDEDFNGDERYEKNERPIGSVKVSCDDDLSDEQMIELTEKAEELAHEEKWDWNSSADADDEDEEDEDEGWF